MKKNLLLTAISMVIMSTVSAQSDRIVTYAKPFVPEHEIRVGYSPLMPLIIGNSDGKANSMRETGAISLFYSYKIERWLEVGGVFTYAGEYETNNQNAQGSIARLTLAPDIRFSWYNSRVVRFYSGISMGFGVAVDANRLGTNSWLVLAAQVTPIGMSVGKKFFCYVEPLCFGTQGNLIRVGLGYRFPAKPRTLK